MRFIARIKLFKKQLCKCGLLLLAIFTIEFSVHATELKETQPPVIHAHTVSISAEERAWIQEIFRQILFQDSGAYVLYGTKPMSWTCIQKMIPDGDDDQVSRYYNSLSDEKKAEYMAGLKDRFDFYTNFPTWKKIKDRLPIRQYLFGIFPPRFESDGPDSLLFINIEMALRTLLKHYEDFKRTLGFDFDPLEAIFEVENRDSKFWKGVMQHDVLLGILLGFGRDNAWFFKWAWREGEQNKVGDFLRSLPKDCYESQYVQDPDPQNFMLPIFGSYGLHPDDQELIEQYRCEREQIKALYKGRDEVDVALDWLTR